MNWIIVSNNLFFMLILLEMIPIDVIYLQNKTKIKHVHVAYKIVKLFKFNTMYMYELFPQSLNVRSPHPMP